MTSTRRFSAPWGKLLWVFTVIGTAIIGGAAVQIMFLDDMSLVARIVFSVAAIGTLVACALFAVRGYRLEGDTLVIERLGWEKRVSLKGLTAVRHDRKLIHGSIRVGNGGLFVFAGYFWSRKLGWFRLAGNDILGRAVLLEIGDKKWMVTPSHPQVFVDTASRLIDS